MKIGINARYLQNIHTGIETYLLNLILNLKKIDFRNEYLLFFGSDKPVPKVILDTGFDCDVSKMPTNNRILKLLWEHIYLPYAIKRNKVDLFHESSFIAPIFKSCPTVVSVYDTAHLYFPFCYTYQTRIYMKSALSLSLKRSNLIIAISENTKRDIINNFDVSADKVQVVYPGVDETFRPFDDKEEITGVRRAYKINKDFILTVGGLTPRKNLTTLIKAFKLLKKERKIEEQLVIVGRKGWLYEEVFKEAASCDAGDVIFCGHIPKRDLLCLYNMAVVFAYPSLYEGFGLPLLEAMACGCPVVTSNVSSMPEVCGNAALLVNPRNVEELSYAIFRLITDGSLRHDLIKKGMEQVKNFSWKKAAKETSAIYDKVNSL